MMELKVRKPETGKESLTRYPGFEFPFLRGSLFNLNPFSLMKQFTEDMDRYFGGVSVTPSGELEVWSPTVEVKQVNGKFLVTAELPGLKKENIKIEVTEEALILEGERKFEKEEKGEEYYRSERSYGRFYRSIPLPEGTDLDKAVAEFKDGVLEISVPVTEVKTKRREIPVNEGAKTKAAA
jgi:HSP20 family protein